MPDAATIHLFTFKAGLLARAAHDLRLHVDRPNVCLVADRVSFAALVSQLRVDGAVRNGQLDPSALSTRDLEEIQANIAEILHADEHPELRFEGEIHAVDTTTWRIAGELGLNGRVRPVEFEVHRRGDLLDASIELVPSRWGVPPYRALAGAIRLRDRVRVDVSVDAALAVGLA